MKSTNIQINHKEIATSQLTTIEALFDYVRKKKCIQWCESETEHYINLVSNNGYTSTNVNHLKETTQKIRVSENGLELEYAQWEDLLSLPIFTNCLIVTWHDEQIDTSAKSTGPAEFNQSQLETYAKFTECSTQTIFIAGLGLFDEKTKTFTILNCLNMLGEGNSGAIIIGIINDKPYIFGEVSSIVEGQLNRTDLLRCERPDSTGTEIFTYDTPCKKTSNKKIPTKISTEERFMNQIKKGNSNHNIALKISNNENDLTNQNNTQADIYLEYHAKPRQKEYRNNQEVKRRTTIIFDIAHNAKHCINCRGLMKAIKGTNHVLPTEEFSKNKGGRSPDLSTWIDIFELIIDNHEEGRSGPHTITYKETDYFYQLEDCGWQEERPDAIVIKGLTGSLQ